MLKNLLHLIFPPKCKLCYQVLPRKQVDLCATCRELAPEFIRGKRSIPHIAQWTAVWYYKECVRGSIHRFKFQNARYYADFYGKELALKIQESDFWGRFDCIAWVPVSTLRYFKRGYDQSYLLARALGKELGMEPVKLLRKIRHTPPQSTIPDAAARRANDLNAYRCVDPDFLRGKRVLLLDDVITTGVTGSECGKTLLISGATSVYLAAVAVAVHDKNN